MRDTTAFRLVYGESDLLPSLIIDRYNDCFVIQTLSQGMDAIKQMWIELLVERYHPRAIIERNEARVRELEGLPRTTGVVYGSGPGRNSNRRKCDAADSEPASKDKRPARFWISVRIASPPWLRARTSA